MKDARGTELLVGDTVAYATTVHPGQSKHAVLKVAIVAKIAFGESGEYALVKYIDKKDKPRRTVIRESQKLVKLEEAE